MPGSGSSLDRKDHRVLTDLARHVARLANEVERLNDNLEASDAEDDDAIEHVDEFES